MEEYSELLTKLMDDVVHSKKVRSRDVAELSLVELAIYMKFLAKSTSERKAEFDKRVKE